MRILLIFLLIVCTSFFSCKKKEVKLALSIEGSWKAGNLVIGDSISRADLTAVRLVLSENSRYYYLNNMAQIQAGTYIVKDSLLITTDTISKPNVEAAVQIIKSTNDTLILRMNMDSVESFLYLVK